MQNYYTPELCVGPTEPNGNVFVMDDYNWEKYSVTDEDDRYWDSNFSVKIGSRCNTSYASIVSQERRPSRDARKRRIDKTRSARLGPLGSAVASFTDDEPLAVNGHAQSNGNGVHETHELLQDD